MSVVVFDGTNLATDSMIIDSDSLAIYRSKLHTIDETTVGSFVGTLEYGLYLIEWYKKGAKEEEWPDFQKESDTVLIIAERTMIGVHMGTKCYWYCLLPFKQEVKDEFYAWGAGTDFAMGALGQGATAEQAVTVASKYSPFCGGNVNSTKTIWKPKRRRK